MSTRREWLRDSSALTLLLGLSPEIVWAQARRNTPKVDPLLNRICDLVIPATDTPGAVAAGAPAFVQSAISLGLRGASAARDAAFRAALDARAGAPFASLSPEAAREILLAIDRVVLGPRAPGSAAPVADDPLAFWRPLKALILAGYYTSEIGGSRELAYELTPGQFAADIPLGDAPRAWSSDWTGVKYA